MEEVLYNIEINRGNHGYLGRIYSDIDGMKEFEADHIDNLFRDIIIDMQLARDEFNIHGIGRMDQYETFQ